MVKRRFAISIRAGVQPVIIAAGIGRPFASTKKAMETAMKRFILLLFLLLLGTAGRPAAQEKVEARGITSEIKLEEVTFGHLTELNGKFKMRATEFTFAPGSYLGVHHHIGPGVRYILSGELTFTEGGRATVYKAGDYYFETGNLAHTAENKTDQPLRILIVEILPKDWTGPAVIPPSSQ
jgi:quercetin dioxygenase-like cupin family protein